MAGGSDIINPVTNPQDWDVIVVGGVKSPGLCKVSQVKRKHEWDIKKGKGVKGSTVTYVGTPPAEFSVTVRIWDDGTLGGPDQFAQWVDFIPAFQYDPTKKQPQAVDIFHPSLADLDINSVVAESIGQLEPVEWEGTQYYEAVIELLEYNPPPKKPAVGTPTGAKATYVPLSDSTQVGNQPPSDEQTLDNLQQQLVAAQQGLP